MGNVTTTLDYSGGSGNQFIREGILTMSTSYTAGGDTLTARQCGLGVINSLLLHPSTSGWGMTIGSSTSATGGVPGTSVLVMAMGNTFVTATSTTGASPVYVAASSGTNLFFSTASATVTVPGNTAQEATAATNVSAAKCRFRAEGF